MLLLIIATLFAGALSAPTAQAPSNGQRIVPLVVPVPEGAPGTFAQVVVPAPQGHSSPSQDPIILVVDDARMVISGAQELMTLVQASLDARNTAAVESTEPTVDVEETPATITVEASSAVVADEAAAAVAQVAEDVVAEDIAEIAEIAEQQEIIESNLAEEVIQSTLNEEAIAQEVISLDQNVGEAAQQATLLEEVQELATEIENIENLAGAEQQAEAEIDAKVEDIVQVSAAEKIIEDALTEARSGDVVGKSIASRIASPGTMTAVMEFLIEAAQAQLAAGSVGTVSDITIEDVLAAMDSQKTNEAVETTEPVTEVPVEEIPVRSEGESLVESEAITVPEDLTETVTETVITEENVVTEISESSVAVEATEIDSNNIGKAVSAVSNDANDVTETEVAEEVTESSLLQEELGADEQTVSVIIPQPVSIQIEEVIQEIPGTASSAIILPIETLDEEQTPATDAPISEPIEVVEQEANEVEVIPQAEVIDATPEVTSVPELVVENPVPTTTPKQIPVDAPQNLLFINRGKSVVTGFTNFGSAVAPANFILGQPVRVPSFAVNSAATQSIAPGVNPRSLVDPQFRQFIFDNDSPDVVAAKVNFFRARAATLGAPVAISLASETASTGANQAASGTA